MSLAASADAFLLMGRHIVQSRLDPIVNPGKVSGHLHTVVGGSAFSKDYSFEAYKNAACSTVEVQADKSNYWIPSIMAKNENGTFQSLPVNEARMYYFNVSRLPEYLPKTWAKRGDADTTIRLF